MPQYLDPPESQIMRAPTGPSVDLGLLLMPPRSGGISVQRSKEMIDKDMVITVSAAPSGLFDSFIAACGAQKWPVACRIETRSRSDSDLAVALTNPVAGDHAVYLITTTTVDGGRTRATGTLARWQTSDGVPVRMQQAEELHGILAGFGGVSS